MNIIISTVLYNHLIHPYSEINPPNTSSSSNISEKFSDIKNNVENDNLEESSNDVLRNTTNVDVQLQSSCISRVFRYVA